MEDLQWLPPTVTTLHKRIAAGAASSGSQPHLSPAGMVQLVERAKDSRNGTVFSALAIISLVCYLRVGEAAGISVSDLAMAGFVQFWNSKTGEEGYTTRPLYRYADGVRAWLHRHMVSLGRSSDMLVWQSGEAGLEAGMAETLAGTAYARARWHALRRGGAAATWARKPDLAYYKWWGRWQSTAVAMQYGTKWSDPGVVAPTVLPAWSRDRGPLPTPERVGVLALWDSPMFPNIAGALSTPTKRKPRRPRGEGPGTTEGGTIGSGDEGDQAATELEESAEDGPAEMGPEPEAAPTPPPLQSLAPASGRGAVSREDAGQLCTLAGPLVAVGGGGGCGPGTAAGPINVDSDVDTDDDSEGSGSEPDGAFAVGSARGSPGRRQTGIAKFVGRERKPWSSRTAAGPVRGGTGAGSKAGMVGRVHRSYTGPRRAKVVVGGAQALRPRAAARRQTGRPRLAQQVDSPEPKRTKLGTGGHVQAPAAQNPVEGAFVAAAEHLKTKARGRAVPVVSPPPPLCKGPDRGRRVREQPPLFLEFMQALTPHFHWIAERERCGLWMVAKRVDLWLNRVFDTAEDFRLRGALPALLRALRTLHPDSWEACLHVNTSPIPRFMGGGSRMQFWTGVWDRSAPTSSLRICRKL